MREELPNRRRLELRKLRVGGHTLHYGVGFYPDGRIGEVWIDLNRRGTAVRAWAESSAKLLSLLLQHGATLECITGTLREHMSEPWGEVPVKGHPDVTSATGVLDAIMHCMQCDYLVGTGT